MNKCIFCASSVPSNYVSAEGKVKLITESKNRRFSPVGPPSLSVSTDGDGFQVQGHLKTLFILIEILKIPREKLYEWIGCKNGANNPELWVSVCESCQPLVKEFYETWIKVSKGKNYAEGVTDDLENRLNEIRKDFKNKIIDSSNTKCEDMWGPIRDEVLKGDVLEKKIGDTISGVVKNPVSSIVADPLPTPAMEPESPTKVNEDRAPDHQTQIRIVKSLREKFERINNAILAEIRENCSRNGWDADKFQQAFDAWFLSSGSDDTGDDEDDDDKENHEEDKGDDNEKGSKSQDDDDDGGGDDADHIELENHGETSKEKPLMVMDLPNLDPNNEVASLVCSVDHLALHIPGEKDEGIEAKFGDSIEEDEVSSMNLEQPGILTLSGFVDDSMDIEGEAKGQIQENYDDNVVESTMEIQNVDVLSGGGDHAALDNIPEKMEADMNVAATEAPLSPVAGPSSRILQLRKDLRIVNPLWKNF